MINLRPLRDHREYRLLALTDAALGLGGAITAVAIPIQVYAITRSTVAVGLLGLAQLAALMVAAPLGGLVADHMDRRRLLLVTTVVMALVPLLLAANALAASPPLAPLYLLAAARSGLEAVVSPVRRSVLPFVVPRDLLVAIQPIEFLTYGVATIVGPLIAGALLATRPGFAGAYLLDVVAFALAAPLVAALRPLPPMTAGRPERGGLQALLEGVRFARSSPGVRGVFLVDTFAQLFGSPVALFPALGADLGAGALGTSALYAAVPAGALLATLASGWTRRVRRAGLVVCVAAAGWGAAVVVAGLSPWLWGVVLALAAAGAADCISGVFRSAIVQQATPLQLQGRVAGLEWVQVNAGPALGDAEAGGLARLAGLRFSIVSGGLLCVVGVGLVALLDRGFLGVRAAAQDQTLTAP